MSSMWRWIKQQLRLEDEDSTRTDLVLVGSRWFAVQLRVLGLLTSPTALAVIVLLRNAFDLDREAMLVVQSIWVALFFVVVMFSLLPDIVDSLLRNKNKNKNKSDDNTKWLLRNYLPVMAIFILAILIFDPHGPISEVLMLAASVLLSIHGARNHEPLVDDDYQGGFWKSYSPFLTALLMTVIMLALPGDRPTWLVLIAMFFSVFMVTVLCFTRWTIKKVKYSAPTFFDKRDNDSDTLRAELRATLQQFAIVGTFALAVAVCVVAVALLVVLVICWCFSWL